MNESINGTEQQEKQKVERQEKRKVIIAQLAFFKEKEGHFKTLYDNVVARLKAAKNTKAIDSVGEMIPFIKNKYDFMIRLRGEFNFYFQKNGLRDATKKDAVQCIYDNFIDEVIKSDISTFALLQSSSSLLPKKYQFFLEKMPESCAALYWKALVNHIMSLQYEEQLSILSRFIAQSIVNYDTNTNVEKKIISLKKELEELGFDPNKEAVLSIVSGEIKYNAECCVTFTQEMVDFCKTQQESYQESLDFVSTKIEAIKKHIVNDRDVVKKSAVVSSRTYKHRTQDNEYYNAYKTSAHHFVAQAKTKAELDIAIKLFCLAEHKQLLQKTSNALCPPPSDANSYLSLQIRQACTMEAIQSIYRKLVILQCLKDNYPLFFDAINESVSELDSKEKASIVLSSFEKISGLRICTAVHLTNFFKNVVAFYEEENPGKMDALLGKNNGNQESISRHIKEMLDQKTDKDDQNLAFNRAVNTCLESHFDSMSESSNEHTRPWEVLSWLFKYGYSRTGTLVAIERLYERKDLSKENIYQLTCNPLCQKLLSDTKTKSIEDLLEKLDYINDIDKEDAKQYCRLSIHFEPLPFKRMEKDIPVQINHAASASSTTDLRV